MQYIHTYLLVLVVSRVQVLQVAGIRHMARSFFRTALRRILLNSFLVSYGTSRHGISYGASRYYAQPLPDCHFCSDSLVFPMVQVAQSTLNNPKQETRNPMPDLN